MLTGNIGAGAINHLHEYGIEVVRGCQGRADLAVTAFLAGTIIDNEQTCSAHEGCEKH
jgi:predicted Fe-Mo cluster-binding NifX family protein